MNHLRPASEKWEENSVHKSITTGIIDSRSLVTPTLSGPSSSVEGLRLTDCICKLDPFLCFIQKTHLKIKGSLYFRVKGWNTVFQAKWTDEARWSSHFNI